MANNQDGYWTEARVEELKSLVAAGLSYDTIANRWGVTRNVPLAKANRLGIVHPKSPLRKRAARLKAEKIGVAVADVTDEASEQVDLFVDVPHDYGFTTTLQRLDVLDALIAPSGGCKYQIGNRSDPGCRPCGEKVIAAGEPYCSEHRARCWTKDNKDAPKTKISFEPLSKKAVGR